MIRTVSTLTGVAFFLGTLVPSYSAVLNSPQVFDKLNEFNAQIIEESPDLNDPPIIQIFSGGATSAIVNPLRAASAECLAFGAEYAASCAAAAFKRAAGAANRPDYRDAKRELNRAARKLEKLVSQNVDKDAPTVTYKGRKLKAVKKTAIAKVKKEAVKIIKETETKLIRSSGSGARKVHYQRIAQAVGSTKVILRS